MNTEINPELGPMGPDGIHPVGKLPAVTGVQQWGYVQPGQVRAAPSGSTEEDQASDTPDLGSEATADVSGRATGARSAEPREHQEPRERRVPSPENPAGKTHR